MTHASHLIDGRNRAAGGRIDAERGGRDLGVGFLPTARSIVATGTRERKTRVAVKSILDEMYWRDDHIAGV
jgi:hypothetical protein